VSAAVIKPPTSDRIFILWPPKLLSEQISHTGHPAIINAKLTPEIKKGCQLLLPLVYPTSLISYFQYTSMPHFTLRRIELNNVSGRSRKIDKFNEARYHACTFLYQCFVTELEDSRW
jgi:hypothetical protein